MQMIKTLVTFVLLLSSFNSSADKPEGSVYLNGGENRSGVILAHGRGKHPRWLVVNPLRKGIREKLGYHTLSLQMPTGYSDWKAYATGFPDAYKSIKQAISYLRNERGVRHVFLLGHSMGSRMSSAFVSKNPGHDLAGLIIIGCRNSGGDPLACDDNMRGIEIPVLDIWGGKDRKDPAAAAERKGMVSDRYIQVEIPGANHRFEGYEDDLLDAVVSWLTNN
ncbi:MAG: alpha/beta hydrolase family protein [Candidatus Thiodiazotropha sp. (ex Lucina pensylvanica)]|nr:alpha/beta hydrolase family protein [Candidatus Thiodiazotropha sp. (ex Lucina pensylvanica)]